MSASARRSGFTLLEVLVAIAILGLGLTVILSSQVGLFSSSQRAQNIGLATHLARCKMGEVEIKLLKEGYPLAEEKDEGPCCEDDTEHRFTCEWKIQRIELPQPLGLDAMGGSGDGGLFSSPGAMHGASTTPGSMDQGGGSLGPLGALASVQQTGGASLGDGGVAGLAGMLSGASGGGTQGIAPLLMGLVYPDLKPMLEASIRKVLITVKWKEGQNDRTLELTQFVTNPLQGGLDPNAAEGVKQMGRVLEGTP